MTVLIFLCQENTVKENTVKKNIIFGIILSTILSVSHAVASTEIKTIVVEGNGRLSDVAVKSILPYREGDIIGDAERTEILQELQDSDLFSTSNIQLQGNTLIVRVTEYPLINDFIFKGNKVLKRKDILPALGVKIRDSYTQDVKKNIVERLKRLYQIRGFYLADITLIEEKKSGNRVDLKFKINEGRTATIKSITFEGNKAYSDRKLRDVISSKVDSWYHFISDVDIYDEARVQVDMQLLEQFYKNRGFVDVDIQNYNATLSENKKDFHITFTLSEGKRYILEKSYIKNPDIRMNLNVFEPILQGHKGRFGYYSADNTDTMLKDIATEMARQGIPFVELDTELEKHTNAQGQDVVDVAVVLKPGLRAFIKRIVIRGNTRTLDKVIRRELEMTEGDPFNPAIVRASNRNIQRLGFFKSVDFSFEQATDPNQIIVYIDVQEQTTGGAGFGIGYSSTGGALFKINVSEENFLGRGQNLIFEAVRESRDTGFKVGFSEPRFMDRKLTAGLEFSDKDMDRLRRGAYKMRNRTLKGYVSYDLNRKWSHTSGLELALYDLYEVQSRASQSIKDEQRKTKGVTWTNTLSYNDLDDFRNPTKGMRANVSVNLNSLGSKYRTTKFEATGTYYHPVTEKNVFSISANASKVLFRDRLRMSDRLYLNSDYIRGFDRIGIFDTSTGSFLGGTTRLVANAELDFPVFLPKSYGVKGVVFATAAHLAGTPKRAGVTTTGDGITRSVVGTGIKWASPIGPMRFDFTRVLKKAPSDADRRFQFTIGWAFY